MLQPGEEGKWAGVREPLLTSVRAGSLGRGRQMTDGSVPRTEWEVTRGGGKRRHHEQEQESKSSGGWEAESRDFYF